MPNPGKSRVPLPASADLVTASRTLQVNHCRNPSCRNYGVPARTERQKPGPSPDRDRNYKLKSTNKGLVPGIGCHAYGESRRLRSNAGIAAEIERLTAQAG